MLTSKVAQCHRVLFHRPQRSLSCTALKFSQGNVQAESKGRNGRISKEVEQMIRVDHAGELGADRIYAGQMAVLGVQRHYLDLATQWVTTLPIFTHFEFICPKYEKAFDNVDWSLMPYSLKEMELTTGRSNYGPLIQHMWDQEKVHRATFEKIIQERRVRPTVMMPIWNVAGFVLGAGTALLGPKAAMACTVAVESVIVEHYNDQLRKLASEPNPDTALMEVIKKFRDEEQEHHDTGLDKGAEQAPLYGFIIDVIKVGCKVAISISKVV